MKNRKLRRAFSPLTTPTIADAALRLGTSFSVAPAGIRSIVPSARLAGRAVPARHFGSVDVLLEAVGRASPGDVLVIDNGGRSDEACIGDLLAIEAAQAGLRGFVIWGLHRDEQEIRNLEFPVFSYGSLPVGPRRLDPATPDALTSARFGEATVGNDDVVFADRDGVLFVPMDGVEDVLEVAAKIRKSESRQARKALRGTSLRQQLDFEEYLVRRAADPAYTFRAHLRELDGEIEE